jgi:hypothetical protein
MPSYRMLPTACCMPSAACRTLLHGGMDARAVRLAQCG